MPFLKKEINQIKDQIHYLHQQTMYYNNMSLDYERDINQLTDQIKQTNALTTQLYIQKDNIINDISLFKKHFTLIHEKIQLLDKNTKELMASIYLLAKNTQSDI